MQDYAGFCRPAQDGVGIPAGTGMVVVAVAEAEAAAVADAVVAEMACLRRPVKWSLSRLPD